MTIKRPTIFETFILFTGMYKCAYTRIYTDLDSSMIPVNSIIYENNIGYLSIRITEEYCTITFEEAYIKII